MVRRENPYSESEGRSASGFGQGPPPEYGDRGMNDDYYGQQNQHSGYTQQGSYGQQGPYGQQQYGQSYAGSGEGESQGSGYQQQTSYEYGRSEYGRQNPHYDPNNPYQANATGPASACASVLYDPSAPPPRPALQPDGTPLGSNEPEEERGLMGALAGAAAGGYGGHKMHHGVLGTLGGAYAGHKLEESYKTHHNQEQQKPPPQQQHQQQPHHQAPSQQMLGNFSASSRNISLDRDCDLIAEARTVDGRGTFSSVNLNDCLTNDDGHLKWQRDGNFRASAREVHLTPDGLELRAELKNVNGQWIRSSIRLDERIGNNNGNLEVVW